MIQSLPFRSLLLFALLTLPTYAEIDIPVRALLVGVTISSVTRYGGYRRFDVNAEKEKLKAPVKP